MNRKEAMRQSRLLDTLQRNGFSGDEFVQLRRISNTLQRWAEAECNGDIERDETTGKPYRVSQGYAPTWKVQRWPVPDREAGAIKRLKAIMAQHPAWTYYHQTDPRGAALYLVEVEKIPVGIGLDCCYSSIGICVY